MYFSQEDLVMSISLALMQLIRLFLRLDKTLTVDQLELITPLERNKTEETEEEVDNR